MFRFSSLTSNKTKIIYIMTYIIYEGLYLLNPILIMNFINNIIAKNLHQIIIYIILTIANFFLIQIGGFFLACLVGKVENENYENYFKKLDMLVANYDATTDISNDKLSQLMGEYYEKTNTFFFIKKVELIFSVITIISIFVLMFLINMMIATILLIFIPFSFWASKKFEKKIYKYAEANKGNSDTVKKYIFDEYRLSKEERFSTLKQLPSIKKYLDKYKRGYAKSVKEKSKYLYFYSYAFLNLAILAVILIAGILTYKDILLIGTLFAFQNYTSQLWNPVEFLMTYTSDYKEARPILKEIEELFIKPYAIYNDVIIDNIRLENFTILDVNNKPLFSQINIEFKKGEIYLIKGRNGIGKTSMIEAILGLNKRYSGNIYFNDSLEHSNNIVYISADAYISKFYDEEKSLGSSGQKKLEQIKFYLNQNKSVYILDEPTNFIDINHKEEIIRLINEKINEDKIIIIISHDSYLDKLSTKIIEL